MEPLSVTTAVLTLLGVCVKASISIRQLKLGAGHAKSTVAGILSDVDSLRNVLQSMEMTLDDLQQKDQFQTTGHIGVHWEHLGKSLKDGQATLVELAMFIQTLNKEVSMLDGSRRYLRLKLADDTLVEYRQHVQSYRDAIQFSVQTIIFWNTLTIKSETREIAPKIETLDRNIQQLSQSLEVKLEALSHLVSTAEEEGRRAAVNRLRACVKSAATVISAASTTIGDFGVGASERDDLSEPSWEASQHFRAWIGSQQESASAEKANLHLAYEHDLETSHGLRGSKAPAHHMNGVGEEEEAESEGPYAENEAPDTPYMSAYEEQTVSSRTSSSELRGHCEQLGGGDGNVGGSGMLDVNADMKAPLRAEGDEVGAPSTADDRPTSNQPLQIQDPSAKLSSTSTQDLGFTPLSEAQVGTYRAPSTLDLYADPEPLPHERVEKADALSMPMRRPLAPRTRRLLKAQGGLSEVSSMLKQPTALPPLHPNNGRSRSPDKLHKMLESSQTLPFRNRRVDLPDSSNRLPSKAAPAVPQAGRAKDVSRTDRITDDQNADMSAISTKNLSFEELHLVTQGSDNEAVSDSSESSSKDTVQTLELSDHGDMSSHPTNAQEATRNAEVANEKQGGSDRNGDTGAVGSWGEMLVSRVPSPEAPGQVYDDAYEHIKTEFNVPDRPAPNPLLQAQGESMDAPNLLTEKFGARSSFGIPRDPGAADVSRNDRQAEHASDSGAVDLGKIKLLTEMGFPTSLATQALTETGGDNQHAVDWLCNRPNDIRDIGNDEVPAGPHGGPPVESSSENVSEVPNADGWAANTIAKVMSAPNTQPAFAGSSVSSPDSNPPRQSNHGPRVQDLQPALSDQDDKMLASEASCAVSPDPLPSSSPISLVDHEPPKRPKSRFFARFSGGEVNLGPDLGVKVLDPKPRFVNVDRKGLDRLDSRFQIELKNNFKSRNNCTRLPQPKIREGTTCMKAVLVGDGASGKTSFINVFSKGTFPEAYLPTVIETYTTDIEVDGRGVELSLWDTAGQEGYDGLRALAYPECHVLMLCFAINEPDGLANIREKVSTDSP
ncbi:Rho GTPase [Vermiconidia calcicola]|uniref:Rho GTPase n=1 Tax=Vermiconidia calcicola TaxID=1690605 RepID=A0ACC3MQ94_9PEZI|nr:Rho GTPase [Vermiconidia calcicola]